MIICKKNFRIVNKSYKFGHDNFDHQAEDSLKINELNLVFHYLKT